MIWALPSIFTIKWSTLLPLVTRIGIATLYDSILRALTLKKNYGALVPFIEPQYKVLFSSRSCSSSDTVNSDPMASGVLDFLRIDI